MGSLNNRCHGRGVAGPPSSIVLAYVLICLNPYCYLELGNNDCRSSRWLGYQLSELLEGCLGVRRAHGCCVRGRLGGPRTTRFRPLLQRPPSLFIHTTAAADYPGPRAPRSLTKEPRLTMRAIKLETVDLHACRCDGHAAWEDRRAILVTWRWSGIF